MVKLKHCQTGTKLGVVVDIDSQIMVIVDIVVVVCGKMCGKICGKIEKLSVSNKTWCG